MGAAGAERPVSHRGKAGRDDQHADGAGSAQYYYGTQTRPAGSEAPAGESEKISMQSRRTGTKSRNHAFRFSCPHWHPNLRPERPRHGGLFRLRPPAGSMKTNMRTGWAETP